MENSGNIPSTPRSKSFSTFAGRRHREKNTIRPLPILYAQKNGESVVHMSKIYAESLGQDRSCLIPFHGGIGEKITENISLEVDEDEIDDMKREEISHAYIKSLVSVDGNAKQYDNEDEDDEEEDSYDPVSADDSQWRDLDFKVGASHVTKRHDCSINIPTEKLLPIEICEWENDIIFSSDEMNDDKDIIEISSGIESLPTNKEDRRGSGISVTQAKGGINNNQIQPPKNNKSSNSNRSSGSSSSRELLGQIQNAIRSNNDFIWDRSSWAENIIFDSSDLKRQQYLESKYMPDQNIKNLNDLVIINENDPFISLYVEPTPRPVLKAAKQSAESKRILSEANVSKRQLKELQKEKEIKENAAKNANAANSSAAAAAAQMTEIMKRVIVPSLHHDSPVLWHKFLDIMHVAYQYLKPRLDPSDSVSSQTWTLLSSVKDRDKKRMELNPASDKEFGLFEYVEEKPLLLSNTGMKSFIYNFWAPPKQSSHNEKIASHGMDHNRGSKEETHAMEARKQLGRLGRISAHTKADGNRHWQPRLPIGKTYTLSRDEKTFLLGDINTSSMVSATNNQNKFNPFPTLINNMYRSPLFQHKPLFPDFLLIREYGVTFSILQIQNVFVCGQMEPSMKVPNPEDTKLMKHIDMVRKAIKVREFFLEKKDEEEINLVQGLAQEIPELTNVRNKDDQILDELRVHECAYYVQRGLWRKFSSAEFPKIDKFCNALSPELNCAYESAVMGIQRLQNMGISRLLSALPKDSKEKSVADALVYLQKRFKLKKASAKAIKKRAQLCHNEVLKSKLLAYAETVSNQAKKYRRELEIARFIHDELRVCPWVLTRDFLDVMESMEKGGTEMMKISGPGDPSGCEEGFSFERDIPSKDVAVNKRGSVRQELVVSDKFEKEAYLELTNNKYDGTDKRKIPYKTMMQILRDNRVTATDIKEYMKRNNKKDQRWAAKDMVEEIAQSLASKKRGVTDNQISRRKPNTMKTMKQTLDDYKIRIQRHWNNQLSALSLRELSPEDNSDDDENIDFTDSESDDDLSEDDEENERRALKALREDQRKFNNPSHGADSQVVIPQASKPIKALKRVTRTILSDGKELITVEFVVDPKLVEQARIRKQKQLESMLKKQEQPPKRLSQDPQSNLRTRAFGAKDLKKGIGSSRANSTDLIMQKSSNPMKRLRDEAGLEDTGDDLGHFEKRYRTTGHNRSQKMRNKESTEVSVSTFSQVMLNIIKKLITKDSKQGRYFTHPVSRQVIGYHDKILSPICLIDLQKKVHENKYSGVEGFLKDMELLVSNSVTFNGKDHAITKIAEGLMDAAKAAINKEKKTLGELTSTRDELSISPVNLTQPVRKLSKNNQMSRSIPQKPKSNLETAISNTIKTAPKLKISRGLMTNGTGLRSISRPVTTIKESAPNKASSAMPQNLSSTNNRSEVAPKANTIKLKSTIRSESTLPDGFRPLEKKSLNPSANPSALKALRLLKKPQAAVTATTTPKAVQVKNLVPAIKNDSGSDSDSGEEEVVGEGGL